MLTLGFTMRKTDVLTFFGSVSNVAKAINVSSQAVSLWGDVVPEGSAYKIQVKTKGKLKVDESLYKHKDAA